MYFYLFLDLNSRSISGSLHHLIESRNSVSLPLHLQSDLVYSNLAHSYSNEQPPLFLKCGDTDLVVGCSDQCKQDPQCSDDSPLPGKQDIQCSNDSPLPGKQDPKCSDDSPLPGKQDPQCSNDSPPPGNKDPQCSEDSPLLGKQSHSAQMILLYQVKFVKQIRKRVREFEYFALLLCNTTIILFISFETLSNLRSI